MDQLISIDRVIVEKNTSATNGDIVWRPEKTLWLFGHGFLGALGIYLFPQFDAFLIFVALTAVTICVGHSVGMHRLLIHRSFETFRTLEYLFIWLGTLVGMGGPMGMIKMHDMRDWHQRQSICPPHPAHQAGFLKDAWWQLCCEFKLVSPPKLVLEQRVNKSFFYHFIQRTWMFQQVPVAVILYYFGGWVWILWGCSLRIAVSLTGHWMVGHFAHNSGHQGWVIQGLPVQGYNLPGLGLITFGENWHGNHHAFPHSAKLGIETGQLDPGFWFIKLLEKARLVWSVKLPDSEPAREGLLRI